jgi:hypothetical protein
MAASRLTRESKELTQRAIGAVAEHFRAAPRRGSDPRRVGLTVDGKRVAVEIVTLGAQAARRAGAVPPRLRFDRVVLSVLGRLRAALEEEIPDGVTVAVTITAPIRLAGKTAVSVVEAVRNLLQKRVGSGRIAATVQGNEVEIRILRGGRAPTSRLVGFVHNRESVPEILFDLVALLAGSVPASRGNSRRVAGERWLVFAIGDAPAWVQTYSHVASALLAEAPFDRVLVVGPDGSVETATG